MRNPLRLACGVATFLIALLLLLPGPARRTPASPTTSSPRILIAPAHADTIPCAEPPRATVAASAVSALAPTPVSSRPFLADAPVITAGHLERQRENRKDDPTVLRHRFVVPDLSLLSAGRTLTFTPFEGVELEITLDRLENGATGSRIWIGHVNDRPGDVIFSERDGIVVGCVRIPGETVYEIGYAGENVHTLTELDFTRMHDSCSPQLPAPVPTEGSPLVPPAPRAEGDAGTTAQTSPQAAAAAGPVIDVMVVYTPATRTGLGGTTAVLNLIDACIATTNTCYANSAVSASLRLARAEEVVYTESGNLGTDLNRLTSKTDGFLDTVHTLRNTYGADMVSLLVNSGSPAGIAWLMTSPGSWFEAYAFSVVHRTWAVSGISFPHELGHNFGCAHDRANAGGQGAYPYSYGYRFTAGGSQYITVMAYYPGIRISHFSNPNVLYAGAPTGVANSEENARTHVNTVPIVAAFRPEAPRLNSIVVTPSTVAFSVGGTQQFTAQGKDQYGNNFAATFTWTATGGTISTSGFYTAGFTAGSYTVTATSGTVSGTAAVTINGPATIVVSPSTVRLRTGGTQQFTAQGYDPTMKPVPATYTWSATGGTITPSGFYTAPSTAGTYTIRASFGTVVGTATATVEVPRLTSIVVAPGSTFVAPSYHRRFSAEGRDQFGSPYPLGTVTWSASGGSISSTGYYTAPAAPGTYTISARVGTLTGTASAKVHTSTMRGDMNGDGVLTASDVVLLQNWVFLGTGKPAYLENADCNGDLLATSSDVVLELNAVFLGQELPPVPPGGTPLDE